MQKLRAITHGSISVSIRILRCLFFSFACHSHMASKTDNYRHHTKVSVSVCRVFASICECVCVCLPAAEASQETKLDKCHHTTAYHIFSRHHPIQHNTHSQQITHAQKSPFVIVCCFCCRRVFFHIQFHCMTYAFLPLMCLRSICINAWPFLFPHVTCMRMRALGLGWPKTNTQNSSIFDKPNYKQLRLVGLMQLTIWI